MSSSRQLNCISDRWRDKQAPEYRNVCLDGDIMFTYIPLLQIACHSYLLSKLLRILNVSIVALKLVIMLLARFPVCQLESQCLCFQDSMAAELEAESANFVFFRPSFQACNCIFVCHEYRYLFPCYLKKHFMVFVLIQFFFKKMFNRFFYLFL